MIAPLTPPDCDLTDFAYMPLDVARLRQSELTSDETPEACWAAVLLWCAAWHEVPAASIPDNDQWQAKQCGYVARGKIDKAWEGVRAGALRGFVKCSDGRLYHTVVAEKARESWESKQRHAYGRMTERVRKANKHRAENGLTAIAMPTFEQWFSAGRADPVPPESPPPAPEIPPETQDRSAGIPPEKALKGESKGEGEGEVNLLGEREPNGSSSAEPTLPACPHDALIAIYHEVLPELPKVRLATPDRRKALLKTWRWVLTSRRTDGERRAETSEQAREWFRDYFTRARANDFLMGRSQRFGEHAGWKCDLDFLLTDRGLKHVIEKTPDQP
jgi:hypothetical protein